MPGTVTVTAPTGPGLTLSAGVFSNVRKADFDMANASLQLTLEDGQVRTFDLKATATITATAAAGVFTFVVNQ